MTYTFSLGIIWVKHWKLKSLVLLLPYNGVSMSQGSRPTCFRLQRSPAAPQIGPLMLPILSLTFAHCTASSSHVRPFLFHWGGGCFRPHCRVFLFTWLWFHSPVRREHFHPSTTRSCLFSGIYSHLEASKRLWKSQSIMVVCRQRGAWPSFGDAYILHAKLRRYLGYSTQHATWCC